MLETIAVSTGVSLSPIRYFRTQFSGEDGAIPDLAGFDSNGIVRILIENKFWAGLTSNQPVGYLQNLPISEPGLLLFVVPQRRLETVWSELASSSTRVGVQLPTAGWHGNNLLSAQVGCHTLAITSWSTILTQIEADLKISGEAECLADLVQLRGLCEEMENTGYVPVTLRELTDLNAPRFLMSMSLITDALCRKAADQSVAFSPKNARISGNFHAWGFSLNLNGYLGWLAVNLKAWVRYGIGPLWLHFSPNEAGRGREVLQHANAWLSSDPAKAFDDNGTAIIPLRITPGATIDVVIENLLQQLKELRIVLESSEARDVEAPQDASTQAASLHAPQP